MMRVKICGMVCAEDVDLCVREGADAVGFIFADGPRRLTIEAAAALAARVPPFVTTVGVFANNSPEVVTWAIARCRLDVLQFSGGEPLGWIGSFGKPTIVVSRGTVLTIEDVREANAIAIMADGTAGDLAGGTGVRADLDAARRLRAASPVEFILAGGLTPGNVAEAISSIAPDAVDVRSGVERDGRKDPALVRAFVRAAKEA